MELAISIFALAISVLALGAGGLINAAWARRVNHARLSVNVMSVSKIETDFTHIKHFLMLVRQSGELSH